VEVALPDASLSKYPVAHACALGGFTLLCGLECVLHSTYSHNKANTQSIQAVAMLLKVSSREYTEVVSGGNAA
jgi:hypothetical protein